MYITILNIKKKIKIDKGFKMAVVEKFKLILLIQNYIKEMLKLTENFPRNGKIVREELIKDSFEILNKVSIGNNSHNKKLKKTLADEAIGDLKVTEFLIEVCEENKYINSKNSYKLKNDLTEIMKCLVGWRKSL